MEPLCMLPSTERQLKSLVLFSVMRATPCRRAMPGMHVGSWAHRAQDHKTQEYYVVGRYYVDVIMVARVAVVAWRVYGA